MDNQNTALNQSVDLISTQGLDEMQTEQAYKTAFNCSKAVYWGNVVIATVLLIDSLRALYTAPVPTESDM